MKHQPAAVPSDAQRHELTTRRVLAAPTPADDPVARIAAALAVDPRFEVRRATSADEFDGLLRSTDAVLCAAEGEYGLRELCARAAETAAALVVCCDRNGASNALAALRGGAAEALLAGEEALAPARVLEAIEASRRQRVQRVAQAELDSYRRFFESGPVTLFRWRASDGWPVETASPNAEQLFGVPSSDFVTGAAPYAERIHPDDLERVEREALEHRSGQAGHFDQEYRIVRADGEVRWVYEHTLVARDASGVITHYDGYVFDVTPLEKERRKRAAAERGLIQAQKLESLGVLAGGVAHDFNNLLTTMMGEAALALHSTEPQQDAARTAIGNILAAARTASTLTRQMLAYAGRSHVKPTEVDVVASARDAARLLASSLPKRVELEFSLCAEPALVMADSTQLQQIVMNLVWNAAEACEERGGHVIVRVEPRSSRGDGVLDKVAIEVVDDGVGMDLGTLERATEPFFSTKFQGRGLGLSAVNGIARFHGGSLEFESVVGKGTTATVLLPAFHPATLLPRKAARPASEAREPNGARVLVVDDQPAVAHVAARSLQRFGYSTHVVESGRAALAVLAACDDPFDAVLIDRAMPDLSGEETLELLRERDPLIATVLTSGYDETESLLSAKRAQPDGFVHKPFTPDELARAIGAAIAIARERREAAKNAASASAPS